MNSINLAWCCDDTYAQHMGVALCSALENLSEHTEANIFIVSDFISRRNKENIRTIASRYNTHLHFIIVDTEHFAGIQLSHYVSDDDRKSLNLSISPAPYFRLALPDLLPKEIKKVLYLDSDLIVQADLTSLWDTDILDCYLAAVPEPDQSRDVVIALKQKLGIAHDAQYFNSGMLLINLEKWRKENIAGQLFDFIRNNPHKITFWDQDALNIFFSSNYKQIDYQWNFTDIHLEMPGLYRTDAIAVVHFIREKKPWHVECVHAFKGEYYKYLKKTPWRKFRPLRLEKRTAFPTGLKRVFVETANCARLISLIVSGLKMIASRSLPNKKNIALCFAKYVVRNTFIHLGLLQSQSNEKFLAYMVHIVDYKAFFDCFCEFFIWSDYGFTATDDKPLILDCGGNMGMAVFYFKNLYPNSKIIIIEPDEKTFALIQENIRCNDFKDITVYNCAANFREGEVDQLRGCQRIQSVRLSSCINESVDLLRLDMNGSERAVIEDLVHSGKIEFIKRLAIVSRNYEGSETKKIMDIQAILEKNKFSQHVQKHQTKETVDKFQIRKTLMFVRHEEPEIF